MARQTAIDLADKIRIQAERSGAQEAEVYVEQSTTTEVRLRQGVIELLQQSSVQGIGLRVFRDRRMGFLYTTDIRDSVLTELVNRTIALTNAATPREENRISEILSVTQSDLEIYDAAVPALRPEDLVRMAKAAEDSAFAQDKRIQTTRDVRCGAATLEVYFSNTFIARQTYKASVVWLSATPIATQGNQRREGTYVDRKRFLSDLVRPEQIGQLAVERALSRLGGAPVPSARMPVIFQAEAAGSFLGNLFPAFSALNVLENRSFLGGKLKQPLASPLVTIIDDGTIRRGLGTRYFDGEGVQTRRTMVVDRGVLRGYLHSGATARRMGATPTGNGIRSYDSLPVIAPTNFYLDAGSSTHKLTEEVPNGLYVTGLAGFGVDIVSGEYSQQVDGRLIEKGVLTKAVEGVTVGGRLDEMLLGIDGVGRDLEFRSNVSSPTIRFKELTVGGSA
ncbi:MAG TPA: TldD/PmbA family protein [Candidatus Saccharimonadales bacterium]|nr:TldD/PmbA family protein [Candidatus Saccharimonadales bacterium]